MRFWNRFRIVFNYFLVAVSFRWTSKRLYDCLARTVLAMMDLPMELGQAPLFTPRLIVRSRQLFIFQPPRPYFNYKYPRPGVVVIH